MLKYTAKRILHLIPVLLVISMVLFGILKAMPGDPVLAMMPQNPSAYKSPQAKQKIYNEIKRRMGYDKSIPEQYIRWLGRVLKGELGESNTQYKPVQQVIAQPLKNTFILNVGSTIIAFILSVIIGIKSAVRRGGVYDKFWQVFSLVGISLPTFFTGLILIFFLAFKLGWLPAGMMPITVGLTKGEIFLSWIKHLILPTITLTIGSLASTSRYVRNSMIDALSQDYIRTAKSKGLSDKVVIYSHAFRNAMIPVVTVVAWAIVGMFSGAAITETIFAYNGIGKIFIDSVMQQDYNVVMALNMMYALLNVFGNLLADLGYALVDPRIRLE